MWYKGKVTVRWTDEHLHLPYEETSITQEEIDAWRGLGYVYDIDKYSGDAYTSKNPMPDWTLDVAKELKLDNPGFTFYRMPMLTIMPTHVDHFRTYMKVFGVERHQVWRTIVFLEDWKPGHYFEVEDYGLVNWKAGDFVMWNNDAPHAASNIGVADRYTLQITGTWNG